MIFPKVISQTVALSNGTGRNGTTVVVSKIKVFGTEDGIFTDNAFE